MKPEIIRKLEKDFDIEIVQLKEFSKWENCFDLDEHNNIRSLQLRDIEIGTLDFLMPIASNLLELSITDANIKNIEILKDFTQLEYLDLSYNPVITESLKYLNYLKKIERTSSYMY